MAEVLKLLAKPTSYDGDEKTWVQWKFSFMSYMGAVDVDMVREAEVAMKQKTPVPISSLNVDEKKRSAMMFSILAQIWKKRAMVVLQTVEPQNGYEALRRMEGKCRLDAPGRMLTSLQHILAYDFSGADMLEKVEHWEQMIEIHEQQTGTMIDDQVKQAVIMKALPEELKASIYSTPMSFDTYDKVRHTLTNLLVGRKVHSSGYGFGDGTPMEVDAMKGGKFNGKFKSNYNDKNNYNNGKSSSSKGDKNSYGKDKGFAKGDKGYPQNGKNNAKGDKGKSKGKNNTGKGKGSDQVCWTCGKKGHLSTNCWHKQVNELEQGTPDASSEAAKSVAAMTATATATRDTDWLMALGIAGLDMGKYELLIDSGSEVTACNMKFGDKCGLQKAAHELDLRGVDGSRIRHHGVRRVPFNLKMHDGELKTAEMTFQVADVTKPVVSVGELLNRGFEVNFINGEGWLGREGHWTKLKRRGNRFMLCIDGGTSDKDEGMVMAPMEAGWEHFEQFD